ncbi:uncharacterized protein [Hetaerina americana]|uniref:uncharacterized protein isoform X2 n=1 Tax=Hetaerina americana TaxID=62018 RepID=UPI003A7F12CE
MAAPDTENYLSVYREFLKEFASTVYFNDPLPVKVTGYILDGADLEGEIIDWTRQYLNQRSCPPALATAVARSVLAELRNVIKDYHELRSQDEEKGPHYDPLRLMHAVVAKVRTVCEQYLLELESGLPSGAALPPLQPPLPGPPFVSTFAIKNHRRRMEDRHVAIEDLNALFGITTSPCLVGYYAIFDGHHGHEAAAYSAAQLHCLLVHSKHYPHDPEAALKDAFFRADEIFIKKCASSKILSGTTALVALVRHRESLHVAWLGDSLGILVRKGGMITQFVNPHTAERLDERNRILSTGGSVFQHFGVWRINGTLAISRAIGDPEFKPHVSALADVVSYPLDGSEHFMILACDGLWDCVSEAHATAFVYDHLRQEKENHADLSKLLVTLAKSRASNDNISVVVVLLSSVEDILASAPPPVSPESVAANEQQEEEDPCTSEATPADGLAPDGAPPPCHSLVNGAIMDVEAATAAADPSSNPFATPFKIPAPGPESPDHMDHAISPVAPPDQNNHHHHHADEDDEDGLVLDYQHHHNGHGDIMTSSFYGNGGANGEDARHLFGDPADLGPETDVDRLDDDGMIMDVGQAAEEEYKARALEFGVEDGLGEGAHHHHRILMQHHYTKEDDDLLGGGDYTDELPQQHERVLQIEDRPVPVNPFAVGGDEDWLRGKYGEDEGREEVGAAMEGEGVAVAPSQFEEETSTRQHYMGVDRQGVEGMTTEQQSLHLTTAQEEEEVEVIPCEEEAPPVQVKGEVVHDEEGIEVGGGSGLEEAEDDSEEEGEWKYVSAKPSEGAAVVPEAISPEATSPVAALADETSCSPALPEQELLDQDLHSLSPALPPRVEAVTPEESKTEDFLTRAEETHDLKAEEPVADDDKFCQDLGFEVVQKTHVEEAVYEAGLLEEPAEVGRESQSEKPLQEEVGDVQEAKSPEHIEEETEDSTMESRLNPDAAEFVPVSPTPLVNVETFSGFSSDFDTFKKEAEACPGEVSGETAAASTPRALASRVLDDDSDAVLSSSFSHDIPKTSADMFEAESAPLALDPLTLTGKFHEEDENKENMCQEEDKENMSQHVTTSDVGSALNRSFEVLEEHVAGNDKDSDFFGSPSNLSRPENKDESEMVSECSGQDLMSDLVPETIQSEMKLKEELQQSSEMTFETSEQIPNVSEVSFEPTLSSQLGEININQFGDFMQPSPVEDHKKQHDVPVDDERLSALDSDVPKMELSPKSDDPPTLEVDDQVELLDHGEKIEELQEPMHHSPILQVCPMKLEDVKEENIQSELLPSELNVVQEDVLVDEELTLDMREDSYESKPIPPEPEVNIPVEPIVEAFETLESKVAEFTTESIVKFVQEAEPLEPVSVVPPSEAVCMSPTFPTPASELSSIIEGSQALSLEENVPAIEEKIQKVEEISESFNLASEMVMLQETTIKNLEENICMPSTDMIVSPEPVEIVDVTQEQIKTEVSLVDVTSTEPLVEVQPKEVAEESIPEDVSKAAAIAGAAAAVAAVAGVATAAAVTSTPSDTKPAKKPLTGDKKQVPDKSKLSSATATKAKTSAKPPAPATRTMASKKPAAPTTNKTAPTPAARTTTAERRPAASTTKPAATTKPATTASTLSSKPKTSTGTKPTTAPTSRVSAAPRTSAAPSRPSTATSTATKTGVASANSKPAGLSRPSTAPPKTTEPKKMLNGDLPKPASASTTASKTSPRKPIAATSTTASKPLGSTRPLTSARGAAAPGKTTTETAAAKAKQSSATGAVNGAVPKTTRMSLGAGAKPSAPAPSRTKPSPATKTATAPPAPGNAKKAKESVNKHISATRLSGVTKSADGKTTGSLAAKTSAVRSPATKTMANGTAGKKAEVNSNTKKVEEKVELLISPHENGIALNCNEMRELDGVVAMEDGVHEAKEQMVLMGDSLSIGEAV